MTNHVLLDNITHKDLKIDTRRSASFGDGVVCTVVFPIEFRQIQSEYPLVFTKNTETGAFEPVALFGLTENENLFLSEERWNASYIPMTIERQPFLIGFQSGSQGGANPEDPVVYIDMDSPRISQTTEGEPVFLEHGGHTPYLEHINSVLLSIHEGHEHNRHFCAALAELNLLEPFSVEVTLEDRSKIRLSGFYTIDEEALKQLNGETLAALHQRGYLEHIYMAVASTVNFRTLITMKNASLQAR